MCIPSLVYTLVLVDKLAQGHVDLELHGLVPAWTKPYKFNDASLYKFLFLLN